MSRQNQTKLNHQKLLIVTQNLPPVICGVGDYATLLAQELQQQNPALQVAFLTRKAALNGQKRSSGGGLAPDFLAQAEIHRVAPHYWSLRTLPTLLRTVKASRAAQVQIHYVPQMYYRAGLGVALSLFALLLRLAGRRVIVNFHESYIPWRGRPLLSFLQRLSFFILLLAASEAVVTAERRAEVLRRWLWGQPAKAGRVVVSPVGSNFPRAAVRPDKAALRQKWHLPIEGLVLCCLGGLRWKEQPNWLLASLRAVQEVCPEVRLLLIGCLPEELPPGHELTTLADTVIYTGYRNTAEVSELLECSDIYLLPLDDGVSGRRTTLMAALEHGLATVSTTISHPTEGAFTAELPVRLCGVTDRASFASLAAQLARDPVARQQLGEKAAAYYQHNFSWPNLARQHEPLLLREQPAMEGSTVTARSILFLNGPAQQGGGEVVLRNTVTGLDHTRFRPVVVFLQPGPLVEGFRRAGITTYLIKAGRFRNLARGLWTVGRLVMIMRRERITIIQSAGGKMHLYGGLAALCCRKPAVMLLQENSAQASKWDKLARFIPARWLIVNSRATLQSAGSLYPHWQTSLVYPGTDVSRFRAEPNPALREALGLEATQVAIAVFARFQRGKGLAVFIEAAALVASQASHVRFFIVGDTLFDMEKDHRSELEIQVARLKLEDRLSFLGFRPDVPELMRAMDIVVSSSVLPEGFGLSVVEAMLTTRPVVATAHGGPLEIIENERTGFLVPPGDAAALAARLLDLVSNPAVREQVGELARESALARFSTEAMLQELEGLYTQILDES